MAKRTVLLDATEEGNWTASGGQAASGVQRFCSSLDVDLPTDDMKALIE